MSADFIANADGRFCFEGRSVRCVLGKSGVVAAADKREGDGASPAGIWPLRRVFYRPDRVAPPETGLTVVALTPGDGWCDAPDDPNYNRLVRLPYAASHEKMWRDDHAYDLVVELGYNDDPPVPGRGSAIFMHLAQPDWRGTEGCIAMAVQDLLGVLRTAKSGSEIEIRT
ncbi:MAG: L,D-transpeptidase family protein [Hyphomonas sp.]|uniref:L,D-transpeptidase family protein n=1 Tax=Hyphomonas sp. TaxID=87 RepID=UPI003529781A